MPTTAPDVDRVFRALADASRRDFVERLAEGPMSVTQLAAPTDLTLAAVVQHVQVLEACGLVTTQKVGRVRTCTLGGDGLSAAEAWLSSRRHTWERRLDRLGAFLDEEDDA